MDKLLRTAEAAELLNIAPKTLWKWVSEEKIPVVRYGKKGAPIRFKLKDINDFIQKNLQPERAS